MDSVDRVFRAIDASMATFVKELRALCRIRSRRQDPAGMRAAAAFLADYVRDLGGRAALVEWRESFPYVVGDMRGGPNTLLNYNHYDVEVQPTGDDTAWLSPPYAAEVRGGALYARGAADDKAPLMSRLHAVRAFLLAGMALPVSVKFVFEGKRFLHSPGLRSFFESQGENLRADAVLWENAPLDTNGCPFLRLGEKGLLYVRLSLQAIREEVSSQFAPVLPSATARMAAALRLVVDDCGRCLIPGFYEGVKAITREEERLVRAVPTSAEYLSRRTGIDAAQLGGAAELSHQLRAVPTAIIAGMQGGSVEEDYKLGLTPKAEASIEIRLVPGQDPDSVLLNLKNALSTHGFGDIRVSVLAKTKPSSTNYEHPFVQLVARTAQAVYGCEPFLEPLSPVIGAQGACPIGPIVGIGVGRTTASVDGPNEHIWIEDYRNSIRHVVAIMSELGKQNVSELSIDSDPT